MTKSLLARSFAIACIVIGGSGCAPRDPFPLDATAGRLEGGELVWRVCDAIAGNKLVVSVAKKSDLGSGFRDVWVAEADPRAGLDAEVVYGVPPTGFRTTIAPETLNYSEYYIAFDLVDVDQFGTIARSRDGVFDGANLTEDHWLDQDGRRVSEPCR